MANALERIISFLVKGPYAVGIESLIPDLHKNTEQPGARELLHGKPCGDLPRRPRRYPSGALDRRERLAMNRDQIEVVGDLIYYIDKRRR